MKKKLALILAPVVLLVVLSVWYVNDYYRSDEIVQQCFALEDGVEIKEIEQGLLIDGPGTEQAIIFYPGAKVEYTAYLPLFYQVAELGTDVFLTKMPCNFAFLGKNRGDEILNKYDYKHWYMAGHSLGGAMAAMYSAEHLDSLEGLILLGAYPTVPMQADGFSVLSIYGSEDLVLNKESFEQGRSFMPKEYTELCIEGGNHAQFGNYGVQKGDGTATLSPEEQQRQTVEAICEMMEKLDGSKEVNRNEIRTHRIVRH